MTGSSLRATRHDSALKHTTGQALYIDDMAEPPGTLHGALVLSPAASGRLRKLDLSAAATSAGVVAVVLSGPVSFAEAVTVALSARSPALRSVKPAA